MADHFLGALKEIERRAQNNILVFSDVLSERLDVIAQSMISKPLSDNDYLKLAELYYKKFSKEKNKQGMLFCLLRMQQIVFLKEHTDKQTDDIKLEFSEEIDAITKAFLSRKRNYYQNSLRNIFQRFILLDTLAYVLLLMLFGLFVSSFLCISISLALYSNASIILFLA